MTLYLIGLGLDWLDLSQKALARISKCDEVYLEGYTSLASYSVRKLERFLGKKIVLLNRDDVESKKLFLKAARKKDVALLIYGDPLSATTHIDLINECREKKVKCEVVQAPSILTAVARTGLQLYKFGKTASIPFWEKNHKPRSFFDILEQNQKIGAHTLFLLDLKPKEKKFLSVEEAIDMLLTVSKSDRANSAAASKDGGKTSNAAASKGSKKRKAATLFSGKTFCVGCARLGTPSEKIVAGPASKVARAKYGKAPYCLIVPAKLHFTEKEFLEHFKS